MKPAISPIVVFRVPKFSWLLTLNECWDELKADIAVSSPEFYETIKDVSVEKLSELPYKVSFTIWKYFNRARFRATPFGTFGAFGITKSSTSDPVPVKIDAGFKVHSFVNWPHKNELHFDYRKSLTDGAKLFSNSSFYCTTTSIRFIATNNKLFEISEIENDEFVLAVLKCCLQPVTITQLFTALNIAEEEKEAVEDLVLDMIALQLLITEVDPNIIGEDYFKRIGVSNVNEKTPYLISEVCTDEGAVDARKFRHIPELIDLLQKIVPQPASVSLQKFTDNFKRKFELREVPLMLALDPEIGVGYDELEQGGTGDDFIKQFVAKPAAELQTGVKLANNFISAQLNSIGSGQKSTIFLDEFDPGTAGYGLPLPNSFSVIATLADDLVILDNIGGVTANALSGRFTLASENILDISRETAKKEAESNNGVLFFDVAYMAEANVDNINRRKRVYGLQLSILSFDTSESPLTLDDIFVSVKGNEIILRSKKLNKRLIPRMASAYNYGRSDLSLFRLLCDLQHQGLQSQLAFSVETIWPDRQYYPRIQFKNLIVSPQMWRIKKMQLPKENDGQGLSAMQQLLDEKQVSRYFKAGSADQTLCFDRFNTDDLKAFITYASKLDDFLVEEVFLPENAAVTDKQGKPYIAQFILNLSHKERLYKEVYGSGLEQEESDIVPFFPPGTEWLYFEIFCHQQRADLILQGPVAAILLQYSSVIDNWFFIRYSQYGNHLRFRMKLNDLDKFREIIASFYELLKADMASGLVSDLQIKTYRRELARYGSDMIVNVEQHFGKDSDFVLSLLEVAPDDLQKYKLCAALAFAIREQCFNDKADFVKAISKISAAFNDEHHLNTADFKKLNMQYQLYLQTMPAELSGLQQGDHQLFVASFISILNNVEEANRMQLFSDLFHMHVNRLFFEAQRTHEMVCYYFILKDIQRFSALKKN